MWRRTPQTNKVVINLAIVALYHREVRLTLLREEMQTWSNDFGLVWSPGPE